MSATISWDQLNARQKHYLKLLFDLDQAKEEQRRESWRTDRVYQALPAAQWRAITSMELSRDLGKIPKGEHWDVIVEELQSLSLIEIQREGERLTHFWLTKAGRKVVRAGLHIPTHPPRSVLTDGQERYARHIAHAGLAPLKEVQAAFLEKSAASEAQIKEWGAQLARIEREARQEAGRRFLEEHTRYEPCAYPGCHEQVKIVPSSAFAVKMYPEPALSGVAWGIAEGWHYEQDPATGKRVRTSNGHEQDFAFYGCSPAHAEAIARMRLQITLVADLEAEQNLALVRYPVGLNQNARLDVAELAHRTARDLVAQASPAAELPTEKKAIDAEARRQIAFLIKETAQEGKELADNLDLFRRLYRLSFRDGWLSAAAARSHLKEQRE